MSSTGSYPLPCGQGPQASLALLEPLDLKGQQIRILRLLPGEEEEPIQCELYRAYLNESPYYEALSYVWGDPQVRNPIFLDGQQVQVTTNLESALRRLRLHDRTRHMWVDALCINQRDHGEKTHQIHLMKDIYKQTAQCLIWLGSIVPDSPEFEISQEMSRTNISRRHALKACEWICKLAESGEDDHWVFDEDNHAAGTLLADRDGNKAVGKFLHLDWWHRVWTIQEAVLPRKTIAFCGHLEFEWSTFTKVLREMKSHWRKGCCLNEQSTVHKAYLDVGLGDFPFRVDDIEMSRNLSVKLTDVLMLHRYRQAGDERDKLFALLGLNSEWEAQLSAVLDYALSQQQVFLMMTTELILLTKSLEPLIRLRLPSTDKLLPTWVHDLSAECDSSFNIVAHRYDLYDASGHQGISVEFSNPPRELKSEGIMVDEIEEIGVAYNPQIGGIWPKVNDQWVQVLGLGDPTTRSRPYPTGGSYVRAFERLIEDSDGEARSIERDLSIWDWLGGINHANVKRSAFGNCLFTLKKGLIGLGPTHMRKGDTVHILFGGDVPFVLRPIKEGADKGSYTYVGHCYVQGIMGGELVEGAGERVWFTLI